MSIATVTTKGQVTIPLETRTALKIVQGTRVEFTVRDDGIAELTPLTGSIQALAGILHHDGPPVTLEEMDDAIADAVFERDQRSRR